MCENHLKYTIFDAHIDRYIYHHARG